MDTGADPPPAQDRPPRAPRRVAPRSSPSSSSRASAGALPSETAAGPAETVFQPALREPRRVPRGLPLHGRGAQDAEALERAAFELAEDCQNEGVSYVEVRFAPQLHVRPGFRFREVAARSTAASRSRPTAVQRAPEVQSGERAALPRRHHFLRAAVLQRRVQRGVPPPHRGHRPSAARPGLRGTPASRSRARPPPSRRGRPAVVGFDLAGQEKGYPADHHREAYQVAHEAFLGKTVHAGEDYGPESIFQAIGDCHADRIGHGTWLFDASKSATRARRQAGATWSRLAQFIADKRITIEVCLTSNQQTVPELAGDLRNHPSARCAGAGSRSTFCTDNRLVSHTDDQPRDPPRGRGLRPDRPQEIRDILIYGFKRSFFPGTYLEKRTYVPPGDRLRGPLLAEAGHGPFGPSPT